MSLIASLTGVRRDSPYPALPRDDRRPLAPLLHERRGRAVEFLQLFAVSVDAGGTVLVLLALLLERRQRHCTDDVLGVTPTSLVGPSRAASDGVDEQRARTPTDPWS